MSSITGASIPLDRVYLVSYFAGNKEMEFEVDPTCTSYFLVVNGPPPMKLSRPEAGVKIYRVPTDQDPIEYCKNNGGYCCRGKELTTPIVRNKK